ncbi:reticulon-1 isoform X2 [Calypte anna]|uniref:reticulon-1 isoform X2 n=1 Tax=Calypte anna TaxID=9244 RepID=UPI0011C40C40|nr:reticulon-1 isoform X2 [Calypte anna]
MSAPPDPQDLLLEGTGAHWAADGADQYGAGAPARDGDGAQQREQLVFGTAREHPSVAMETTSPGVTASSHLFDYGSTANGGDSSFYTSLISDVHYTTPRDSTYFTGIYQQENSPIPCSGSTEGFNTLGHPVQDVSGFESRGLFSSDSGIEMTPAESTEVNKTLADPMKVEAYKYMDISRSEEIKYQGKHDSDSEDESPGLFDQYQGISTRSSHTAEPQRTASESIKAVKEQDLLQDTRSGDQHSASMVTAPVKITLTETESAGGAASKESSPTQPETGLKPSHEVVPTVMVSEPEDDSPGSVTPPSSGTAIDLLYWRDIKQTGIVFGSLLLLLFSLTQFSVVSVVAYLALAGLSATISFRIYKSVLQAVQKTDEGHPFKTYLEMEMNLSQDQVQKYTDCLQLYVNSTVKELRRLFLVQDLVDSLKFAVLMWLLTYVGALFNGLTLLIMAVVSMFTLPVVYDKYQAQIDQYLGLVRTHINTVVAKIQAKIPGAKRKAE